ncbi:MAG: FKBP-type peptidyl-prolyl cis-trans isomerase [Sediminibacterium sp.]
MKKSLIALGLLITFAVLSCGKTQDTGCTPVAVAAEKDAMVKFCTDNSITYSEHPSGLLYQIINPGTGATLDASSTVSAIYTGKYLNGVTFEANATPATFGLNQVIEGWKIGIPLVKRGGRIRLIIPSALAYSCVGRGSIPPNTPLYFDVTVN